VVDIYVVNVLCYTYYKGNPMHASHALNVLTEHYTQSHRKYHTLEHIAYMFKTANDHAVLLTEAQKIAIWWHDAVYVPGSKTNERDSIVLMINTIKLPHDLLDRVVGMIEDTITHVPRTKESEIVSDLDMFGFAAPTIDQTRFTKQIYDEFKHVPIKDFRTGRLQFLEGVKAAPIYYSDVFKQYSDRAIQCIDNELAELRLMVEVNKES
jgi:predicted metal-dependent HD superfamily phosphohydrolase